MQPEFEPEVLKKLDRAELQVRNATRMLEEGRSCREILRQIHAARKALREAKSDIVQQQFEDCIKAILESSKAEVRLKETRRLIALKEFVIKR